MDTLSQFASTFEGVTLPSTESATMLPPKITAAQKELMEEHQTLAELVQLVGPNGVDMPVHMHAIHVRFGSNLTSDAMQQAGGLIEDLNGLCPKYQQLGGTLKSPFLILNLWDVTQMDVSFEVILDIITYLYTVAPPLKMFVVTNPTTQIRNAALVLEGDEQKQKDRILNAQLISLKLRVFERQSGITVQPVADPSETECFRRILPLTLGATPSTPVPSSET